MQTLRISYRFLNRRMAVFLACPSARQREARDGRDDAVLRYWAPSGVLDSTWAIGTVSSRLLAVGLTWSCSGATAGATRLRA